MLHEVDDALRKLVETRALAGGDVKLVFDAPTREWAAQRNTPTINAYLYDIREDVVRRERGWARVHGPDGRVSGHRRPPRFYRVSYLITAWTRRAEDEHRLLSAVLGCLLRHETLPEDVLPAGGTLVEAERTIPLTVAVPPPESRSIADIWSALGGELKPSLDVVVVAPFPLPDVPAAPLVTEIEATVHDRTNGASETRRKTLT